MRAARITGQGLLYLLGSTLVAVLLLTCVRELFRAPDGAGLWGGAVPITEHKWPWIVVLLALLLGLWLLIRRIGGQRGLIWGAAMTGVRTLLTWSSACLLLFAGVALYGLMTHPIADLMWGFALGYLISALLVFGLCLWLQRRLQFNR
jgi:hypothetical protein